MYFLEQHRNQQRGVRADSPSQITNQVLSRNPAVLSPHMHHKVTLFKNRNQGEDYEKHRTAFLQEIAVQPGLESPVGRHPRGAGEYGMIFTVSQQVKLKACNCKKKLLLLDR